MLVIDRHKLLLPAATTQPIAPCLTTHIHRLSKGSLSALVHHGYSCFLLFLINIKEELFNSSSFFEVSILSAKSGAHG